MKRRQAKKVIAESKRRYVRYRQSTKDNARRRMLRVLLRELVRCVAPYVGMRRAWMICRDEFEVNE